MILKEAWNHAIDAPRRALDRAAEPIVLFPAIAILVLGVIWATTINLIRVERAAAERTAAVSSREQAETYEAQAMRALREIDQTLKLIKYAYERKGERLALQDLRERNLLPPDLFFEVSIADSQGRLLASARPSAQPPVVDPEDLRAARAGDTLSVGKPRKAEGSRDWRLQFSRQLNAADGSVAGLAIVGVNATYFVSSYDASTLGEHGLLGLIGSDGIVRAMRVADAVSAGEPVDYAAMVPAAATGESEPAVFVSTWGGVPRYTSARQLYDFPLAVVVGLSEDEQTAVSREYMRTYLWRASGASLLVVFVVAVLGRLSAQLAQSRRRAADEQVAHAARVEYLAYHDGLTSLPNRGMFSKLLEQGIHQAHRYERQLAVLFLDLDRFKQINDTLGHVAGDRLLQEVAARLKTCLRDSDTVARLGGDEFVVLLPELGDQSYAAAVAQKILAAVARPFSLIGQDFRVTASIGISIYPQDGLDEQALTKNADIAMYQAKGEGKNNFQYYSEKLNVNSLQRLTLESGLRHAVERSEFELHYQAKRDIRSGRITGVEALLRWQHPDLGTIAPMQFIPVAEETGLIVPIGRWVLVTACRQNVAWREQGLPPLIVAVNLTARQFTDERLLADLAEILATTGMDARLLELEIAESLLMRDVDKSLRMLGGLRDLGVRIAIDDFGIGYSSLSTLKRFPLDTIKIDRSFIRDMESIAEDKALTEAIIAMGRTLSMTVVAQGVETKEQAEFLRQHACDEFQGFFLNRPAPAERIASLLLAQRGVPDDALPT